MTDKDIDNLVRLTPEFIADLKRRKLLRETEESIDLPPPAPGERVIGTLTDEERAVYVELVYLDGELADWGKELAARTFERAGKAIRASKGPDDVVRHFNEDVLFESEEEGEEYFREQSRLDYLRQVLWFTVRARLDRWGAALGIRAGYNVVQIGQKFKVG